MPRFASRRSLIILAPLTLLLAGVASFFFSTVFPAFAANAANGHADLVHVGPNPLTCTTIPGTASGVVNVHSDQNGSSVNVSVHDALPNQGYVVDIRCVHQIGTLTTNSQGTGTAHIDLTSVPFPTGPFYIDISVLGGSGGAGGYGDTFIAGPFTLN